MSALDMAALLGVSAETVCRWERGHRAVSRAAFALLAAILTDAIDGRTSTVDTLRALASSTTAQAAPHKRHRTGRR